MLNIKSLLTSAAAAIALVASPVAASSFSGSYWDTNSFSTIDDVYSYVQNNDATATFTSTAIDYPNAGGSISDNTTLQSFLGATDGLTLSSNMTDTLYTSVFVFSGVVDLTGIQSIKVGSDDGFGLKLNGVEVMRHSTPRGFAYTMSSFEFTGSTTFELTYYENYGYTGVEFQIGNEVVNASMAPPAVPLPAALPLLAGALGGLGLIRRKARRA